MAEASKDAWIRLISCVAVLFSMVFATAGYAARVSPDHVVAIGIALQTWAVLLAGVQLWANSASDRSIRWAVQQIETDRWHLGARLNGNYVSALMVSVSLILANTINEKLLKWSVTDAIRLPIAIVLGALFLVLVAISVVMAFMLIGAEAAGSRLPVKGKPL